MNQVDRRDELASAFTHGVGLVASIVGTAVLVFLAVMSSDVWRIVSTAIFGTTLITLYVASTAFHAVEPGGLKARLQVLDHCAIYLLIAGSYTPFALVGLRGGLGWSLFGVIWGLTVAGVIFKLFFTGRFHLLSTAIYLGMGWLAIVAIEPMIRHLEPSTLTWIVAGGAFYTAGTGFHHSDRIPFAHANWHSFVVGGRACHMIAVGTQL
jgi:hemolysin III